MKTRLEKLTKGIRTVFGWGILAVLLIGALTFFGYLAALIAGGETAAGICAFIYRQLYPVLVVVTTSLILLGLVCLYITEFLTGRTAKEQKTKSNAPS